MSENEAELALTALAADIVTELGEARAAEILALTGQAAGLGGTDEYGTFHPAPPPQHRHPALSHLISGGADMSHAISGGAYAGHLMSGMARGQALVQSLGGSDSAAEAPGGQQGTDALTDAEMDRRGVYTAARGTTAAGTDVPLQQPEHPAGLPNRPARRRRTRWR